MDVNRKLIVTIDPGIKGAVTFDIPGKMAIFEAFEKEKIVQTLGEIGFLYDAKVYIEKQQASPQQGRTSAFTTGKGYGHYLGVIEAFGIQYEEIMAKKWMRHIGVPGGMKVSERKKLIAQKVQPKFPEVNLYGPNGGLKDGISDSLGILIYARYIENKVQ